MKIVDIYSHFIESFEKSKKGDLQIVLREDPRLETLKSFAEDWGMDLKNVLRWMKSTEYKQHMLVAEKFITQAPKVVKHIENIFGETLKGEVRLSPSLMRFDGFARYDSGSHTVWFGVDHPDATESYLDALMSHELSHVYRDHQPKVWGFLNKPLAKVSRQEYLDNSSALEHLVSEGLATLFSQIAFPKIPLHVHHYYFAEEMEWCLKNFAVIDKAIRARMKKDEDVWSFYAEDAVAPGSPSRTQYFWAAKVLSEWLLKRFPKKTFSQAVIEVHGWAAVDFDCFRF